MAAVPAVTQTSRSHNNNPSTQIDIGPDSAAGSGGKVPPLARLKLDFDWTEFVDT